MSQENAQLNRNEDCRREVRGYLATVPSTAPSAAQIRRWLFQVMRADWSADDVTNALAFLLSKGDVAEVPNGDGATRYFQITAQGILTSERNPL